MYPTSSWTPGLDSGSAPGSLIPGGELPRLSSPLTPAGTRFLVMKQDSVAQALQNRKFALDAFSNVGVDSI